MYEKIYENPEIFKIDVPLPNNPLKSLNCYVVKTPEKNLIIDTGFNMQACYNALKEGLDELDIDIDKSDMFLTHLHSDHTGLVGSIMKKNSTIYMSKIDYEYLGNMSETYWELLSGKFVSEGFSDAEMKVLWNSNPAKIFAGSNGFSAVTFEDNFRFMIGDYEFTCILTPGHTPGHACLYMEKEKIMFLGDHVLFDISPNITQWDGAKNSLKDYIESLKKIQNYKIELALPAHRKNEMDVYERIDQLMKHHDDRLNEILKQVITKPGINSYEVSSYMKWSMRGKDWTEFPLQQKIFAVGETLSHLDYLIEENKLIKRLENGIYRYYRND